MPKIGKQNFAEIGTETWPPPLYDCNATVFNTCLQCEPITVPQENSETLVRGTFNLTIGTGSTLVSQVTKDIIIMYVNYNKEISLPMSAHQTNSQGRLQSAEICIYKASVIDMRVSTQI